MAIDLKAQTPKTTIPATGVVFGADSTSAAGPSLYTKDIFIDATTLQNVGSIATLRTIPVSLTRGVILTGYYSAGDGVTGIYIGANQASFTGEIKNVSDVATFTGSISGDVLTIGAVTGKMTLDRMLVASGVADGTVVLEQLTGTAGGAGTYRVSKSQSVASTAMALKTLGVLSAQSFSDSSKIYPGMTIALTSPNITATVVGQVAGTGETGRVANYFVLAAATASSRSMVGKFTDNGGNIIVPTAGDGSTAWVMDFNGILDVTNFGARGTLTGDDTDAFQRTADYLGTGLGAIYIPPGTYNITKTVTFKNDRVAVFGAGGPYSSNINFSPTADDICFFFGKGGEGDIDNGILTQCSLRGLTFNSYNTTFKKTAVEFKDCVGTTVEDIIIGSGVTWIGNTSIGFRLRGRDSFVFNNIRVVTNRPFSFARNVIYPSLSLDQCNFNNILTGCTGYVEADPKYGETHFFFEPGVNFSNVSWTGFQSWNQGKYGIYYDNSSLPAAGSSYGMLLQNVRREGASNAKLVTVSNNATSMVITSDVGGNGLMYNVYTRGQQLTIDGYNCGIITGLGYTFTVSGSITPPTVGDTWDIGSNTYVITAVNLGASPPNIEAVGGFLPPATGTLTKTGSTSIAYTARTTNARVDFSVTYIGDSGSNLPAVIADEDTGWTAYFDHGSNSSVQNIVFDNLYHGEVGNGLRFRKCDSVTISNSFWGGNKRLGLDFLRSSGNEFIQIDNCTWQAPAGSIGLTGYLMSGTGTSTLYALITYRVNVSGVTTDPAVGNVYTINNAPYSITAVSITGTAPNRSGTIDLIGPGLPSASFPLARSTGSGDASITFTAPTVVASGVEIGQTVYTAGVPATAKIVSRNTTPHFRVSVNSITVVSTVAQPPVAGDQYTSNGVTYTVVEVGTIYTASGTNPPNTALIVSGATPPAEGAILTKTVGPNVGAQMTVGASTQVTASPYVFGYAPWGVAWDRTYRFTVANLATSPIVGTVYTLNNVRYTVTATALTSSSGVFSGTVDATGISAPAASGTLTKTDGIGPDLAYSAFTTVSQTTDTFTANTNVHQPPVGFQTAFQQSAISGFTVADAILQNATNYSTSPNDKLYKSAKYTASTGTLGRRDFVSGAPINQGAIAVAARNPTVVTLPVAATAIGFAVISDSRGKSAMIAYDGVASPKTVTLISTSKSGTPTLNSAAKTGGNTGNGTMSAPTAQTGILPGVYTVTFTSATAFTVIDPQGNIAGTGTVGTAFAAQVGFTITAGGTAFIAGDAFTITVSGYTADYGVVSGSRGQNIYWSGTSLVLENTTGATRTVYFQALGTNQ